MAIWRSICEMRDMIIQAPVRVIARIYPEEVFAIGRGKKDFTILPLFYLTDGVTIHRVDESVLRF